MANNISVTAGSGTTLKTTDNSGVHTPHHNVDTVGGQSPAYGSGAAGATVPRVVLATDSPGVTAPGQTTMSASLPVTIASDQTNAFSATVALTRTNDTNAYAANDIVGGATGSTAALTFANMGPSGKNIVITSTALLIEASAVIASETSYRLHLYNVTPPSAPGDNAAWDLAPGDRSSYLGFIDLGPPADLGSTLYVEQNSINKQVKLSGTGLFGLLVTNGAYTPTASRVFDITLYSVAV